MKVLVVLSFLFAAIMADSVLDTIRKINDGTYRYAVFKLDDNLKLQTDVIGNRDETLHNFLSHLPLDASRYGVYDVNNDKGHKLVFIRWTPYNLSIRDRLEYAVDKQMENNLKGYQYATEDASYHGDLENIPYEEY